MLAPIKENETDLMWDTGLLDHRINLVSIAFTTRCTLKCTYCPVSLASYKGEDLDLYKMPELIAEMKQLGVRYLNLNGHGETTMIEGWDGITRDLLDHGFECTIASNFGRYFSENEINVLSRMTSIMVSIDSVDREKLRKQRRNVDLRTVITNLIRVKTRAILDNRKPPKIIWNAVLTVYLIDGLRDWAATGIELGVDSFMLANLNRHDGLEEFGELNQHPSVLPPEQISNLIAEIEEIGDLIRAAGREYHVQHGLMSSLKARLVQKEAAAETANFVHKIVAMERRSVAPSDGMTRDCLDPWFRASIRTDGSVKPCCATHKHIGNLWEIGSLNGVLNGEAVRALREELLTGKLGQSCKTCPIRGVVPIESLKEKVKAYQGGMDAWALVQT